MCLRLHSTYNLGTQYHFITICINSAGLNFNECSLVSLPDLPVATYTCLCKIDCHPTNDASWTSRFVFQQHNQIFQRPFDFRANPRNPFDENDYFHHSFSSLAYVKGKDENPRPRLARLSPPSLSHTELAALISPSGVRDKSQQSTLPLHQVIDWMELHHLASAKSAASRTVTELVSSP